MYLLLLFFLTFSGIRCPDPAVFENGEFFPRGPFFVHSNITFICNDGYIPRGSMVRTCKKNGKWSGETAICDYGGEDVDSVHYYCT